MSDNDINAVIATTVVAVIEAEKQIQSSPTTQVLIKDEKNDINLITAVDSIATIEGEKKPSSPASPSSSTGQKNDYTQLTSKESINFKSIYYVYCTEELFEDTNYILLKEHPTFKIIDLIFEHDDNDIYVFNINGKTDTAILENIEKCYNGIFDEKYKIEGQYKLKKPELDKDNKKLFKIYGKIYLDKTTYQATQLSIISDEIEEEESLHDITNTERQQKIEDALELIVPIPTALVSTPTSVSTTTPVPAPKAKRSIFSRMFGSR